MTTTSLQEINLSPVPAALPRPLTLRGRILRRMTGAVVVSILLLIALLSVTIFAEVFAPHDPGLLNLRARLDPPGTPGHIFGTDQLGRDVLSRTIHGGRISLLIGASSTVLGLLLGVGLGVLAGYGRGWLDEVILYLVDLQLSLPFLLLAVAVALVLGDSLPVLIGLAALSTWPVYTRVCRGMVLSLRERDFVVAARAMGAGDRYIMLRHLLPNLVGPVMVLATLSVGRVILLESGLSFLGIGVQSADYPTWGNMIGEGREQLAAAWWIATVPGVALVLLTMAIGTLGDWMRDLTDVSLG
ncbi:MAG: ABC transporter permease [bacterium]|nr:ABC transporter permease [bacterium]